MRTPAQIASERLSGLYNKGVHNRATYQLEHDLDLWEQATGKTLGGKYGMTAPRNATPEEKFALDAIINNFIEDDSTTLQGIKEQFKNLPSGMKTSGKKYSVGEMAHALDVAERMRKEQAIKQTIGSNQYKYMWSVAKEQGFKSADMIDAMYAVSQHDTGISVEQLLLGEGLTDVFSVLPSSINDEYYYYGDEPENFEDNVINYLLNIMEVRR